MRLNQDSFQSETEYAIYRMGHQHGASCSNYAQFVESRFKAFPQDIETMLHAGVGIAGEAGELLDCLKKSWVYGKPVDYQNLQEELGDLLFYIVALANQINTDLGQLQQSNMEKLEKRYPLGYTDAAAIARADKDGTK